MGRSPAACRKSDFTPAFEAAKESGFDQVSVEIETADGRRFLVTAACGANVGAPAMTPLEKWKVEYAAT
ncbi:hypothetical protein [Falsihalocynthiibacter sp. CO-5D18]|uniref:hypothetical protein n=1 Tax=Falsihalocynthiibacter sp. CO-5D18 TaxID=3240872 RepID=UPI00350FADC4